MIIMEFQKKQSKTHPFQIKLLLLRTLTDIPQFASDFLKFISCYIITTTAIKKGTGLEKAVWWS